MSRPLALVTGASSGIGREIARVLAANGYDLLIVARRLDRLNDLATELHSKHGATVHPLQMDLRQSDAPDRIMTAVTQLGRPVDVLINDAGLGRAGDFASMDESDIDQQLEVNILALTRLTRLVLPTMLARHQGRILNVGSIAGYLPGPGMAIYYATKAFVLSFSEALWQETRGTGVTVTCLCPGLTHTEFHASAHQAVGRVGWMSAASVAAIGFGAMMKGQRVANAGWFNTLIAWTVHVVPHRILLWGGRVRRR